MHRLQIRICALNGFNYAPFWMNDVILNTQNTTINPKFTTADVADQVVLSDQTGSSSQDQQIEFLELAPRDLQFNLPDPTNVDIAYEETARSWLTRPYPIASGAWTGDQAIDSTILFELNPLRTYLNILQVVGKIEHFAFLRCGLKFQLRLNGTRFHYGLLVAGFQPLADTIRTYQVTQNTAQSLTMFPGVTLDASSSEVGEFEVPYVHPWHFMPLTTDENHRTLGALYIKVLVPLRVVSETTVPRISWTLHVSCTKPVLAGYTAAPSPLPALLEEQCGDSATRFVPEAMNFFATDINDVSVRTGMQANNNTAKDESTVGFDRSDMLFSKIFTKPN